MGWEPLEGTMTLSLSRLLSAGRAILHSSVPPVLRAFAPDQVATAVPIEPRRLGSHDPTPLGAQGPTKGSRDHGPLGVPGQRRHPRVRYHAPVTVYGPTSFCAGVIEDLSESGMGIRTYWPMAVDTEVDLMLDLPGHRCVVYAIVRWRRVSGPAGEEGAMGLEFTRLSDSDRDALARFLYGEDAPRSIG